MRRATTIRRDEQGVAAIELHGNLGQNARTRNLVMTGRPIVEQEGEVETEEEALGANTA